MGMDLAKVDWDELRNHHGRLRLPHQCIRAWSPRKRGPDGHARVRLGTKALSAGKLVDLLL